MQSHAEAEGLRVELEQARADLRRHEERAKSVARDLDEAWTSAGEAHVGSRALATELDRAKADANALSQELLSAGTPMSRELVASGSLYFGSPRRNATAKLFRLGESGGLATALFSMMNRKFR